MPLANWAHNFPSAPSRNKGRQPKRSDQALASFALMYIFWWTQLIAGSPKLGPMVSYRGSICKVLWRYVTNKRFPMSCPFGIVMTRTGEEKKTYKQLDNTRLHCKVLPNIIPYYKVPLRTTTCYSGRYPHVLLSMLQTRSEVWRSHAEKAALFMARTGTKWSKLWTIWETRSGYFVQIFFFSTRLFDRRMFSSKDCFTGQSPGIGHDASHLYTGSSRMCRGEGQVQAGLLRRGLEAWCSGEGWWPQRGSHWWKGSDTEFHELIHLHHPLVSIRSHTKTNHPNVWFERTAHICLSNSLLGVPRVLFQ